MTINLHVSIDYDEGVAGSYRGVSVKKTGGEEVMRWASGNPQVDWQHYVNWSSETEGIRHLVTSSVTHFLWDVPGWRMVLDERNREIIVPETRPRWVEEAEARAAGALPGAEELARHPDLSVRIWNAHIEGDSVARIAQDHLTSRARVKAVLEDAPPPVIAQDPRFLAGQRGIWVSQKHEDALKDPDGTPWAFIVLFVPYRSRQAGYRKAVAAIVRDIRGTGHPKFDFGEVAEREDMGVLLRMVHVRGYPAWEIGADGSARRYDGRHADLVPAPHPMSEAAANELNDTEGATCPR
ncbi:hypothetical protein LAZ40_02400 [Cereibacter sphaeroides]|uniref:hypothetical protein n=1 Tax=Cereibacter sphaeroides TaxID=1063 RepID=UPI001F4266C8|nr:hypothetical protein [Cereibacter sphaeroides]MCE6957909.1 hypothetical protein [Cereibacter sphaeroides]MCE6971743.1 hypothetical protein [Cereibacter sphaeroides]